MVRGLIFTAHKYDGKVCVEEVIYARELKDKELKYARDNFDRCVQASYQGKPLAYCIVDNNEDAQLWGYYDGESLENFLTMVEVRDE